MSKAIQLILRAGGAIGVIAVVSLFAVSATATESTVSVETWSTAVTPLAPELHFLLRSNDNKPLDFLLVIGRGQRPGGGIKCDLANLPLAPPEATRARSLRRRSFAGLEGTLGVIPPRGWAHRAYLIGFEAGKPPCQVEYELTIGEMGSPTYGTIHVPTIARKSSPTTNGGALSFDHMVETNRFLTKPQAILRVLASNRRNEAVDLKVGDVEFACEGGDPPAQDDKYATLPGEDTGPLSVEPGGHGAFVLGLNVPAETSLDGCVASITFVEIGSQSTITRQFELSPAGIFAGGGHGFGGGRTRDE